MSTTQLFRFFDLPTELRLMVYEHLHTPQRVVQQMPSPSEPSGQVKFRYMTFAVGALATCKLMRDEVQPFFNKAFKTGENETNQTFSLVDDFKLCTQALSCFGVTFFLMRACGNRADGTWTKDQFRREIKRMKRQQKLAFPVAAKAGFLPIIHRAAQVYKKFGRRFRINMHWSGGHITTSLRDTITQKAIVVATQHMLELVFNSEPKSKPKTDEAGV